MRSPHLLSEPGEARRIGREPRGTLAGAAPDHRGLRHVVPRGAVRRGAPEVAVRTRYSAGLRRRRTRPVRRCG